VKKDNGDFVKAPFLLLLANWREKWRWASLPRATTIRPGVHVEAVHGGLVDAAREQRLGSG